MALSLTLYRFLKDKYRHQIFLNIYRGTIAFKSSSQTEFEPNEPLFTPINFPSLWNKLVNVESLQENPVVASSELHSSQQRVLLNGCLGSFRDWIIMVFLDNTTCVNSSTSAIDPIEFNLAFRGIQSLCGNISKRHRDEIFNRVLRILSSKQLPPLNTMMVDCINLLTSYVQHISQPFVLLKASLHDIDESNREGDVTGKVPLITLANILDLDQGLRVKLAAMLALKFLAEVTLK